MIFLATFFSWTDVAKIKDIEVEMAKTQKNKATSFHLGISLRYLAS